MTSGWPRAAMLRMLRHAGCVCRHYQFWETCRLRILVTGGAGFIGSAVCRHIIRDTEHAVVNVDKLTYSANLASLAGIDESPRYAFVHADICDGRRMLATMEQYDV